MESNFINFEKYKTKGELSREEFETVSNYNYSETQYDTAIKYITGDSLIRRLEIVVTDDDVKTIAKLIGALGDRIPKVYKSEKPNILWLIKESNILQGKSNSKLSEEVWEVLVEKN